MLLVHDASVLVQAAIDQLKLMGPVILSAILKDLDGSSRQTGSSRSFVFVFAPFVVLFKVLQSISSAFVCSMAHLGYNCVLFFRVYCS